MIFFNARASAIAISTSVLMTLPAAAIPLIPGMGLDPFFYEDFEITAGDGDWFGTELATVTQTVRETRDGFGGFESNGDPIVISDLYDVTAGITSTVSRSASGRLVFEYEFLVRNDSRSGSGNGAQFFNISGFEGYDVDFGWLRDTPTSTSFDPRIGLSADGDTISFDFLDPDAIAFGPIALERFFFAVDAPAFQMDGSGTVAIEIFSFGPTVRTLNGLPAPSVVPLPASIFGMGFGLAILGLIRRRRL